MPSSENAFEVTFVGGPLNGDRIVVYDPVKDMPNSMMYVNVWMNLPVINADTLRNTNKEYAYFRKETEKTEDQKYTFVYLPLTY